MANFQHDMPSVLGEATVVGVSAIDGIANVALRGCVHGTDEPDAEILILLSVQNAEILVEKLQTAIVSAKVQLGIRS